MARKKRWPKGAWMKLKSVDTLRALMAQDDMSLRELARYAGCSKGFISHLLAGRKSSCSPELGEQIARALHIPVTVLFDVKLSPSEGSGNKNGVAA
jgi:transcriptional regulator with XRE-family HTH domain